MHLSEIIPFVMMFATGGFIAYLWLTGRHKERMALIEHNREANIFNRTPPLQGSGALKIGLLLAFAGAGLLLGFLFGELTGIPEELGIFSFLFMFGGAGLISYYKVARGLEKEREEKEELL